MKKIEDNYMKQYEELEKQKKENEVLKTEMKSMNVRICKMLGYSELKSQEMGENGLKELEQHFQAVGLTVIKQQEELTELRHFKTIAQRVSFEDESNFSGLRSSALDLHITVSFFLTSVFVSS